MEEGKKEDVPRNNPLFDPNVDDSNINEELTIESMLQVIDGETGGSLDVRQMLGIQNKDIKDNELRGKIENYSIIDSHKFREDEDRKGQDEMHY